MSANCVNNYNTLGYDSLNLCDTTGIIAEKIWHNYLEFRLGVKKALPNGPSTVADEHTQ